jgi:hypothetical protein
VLRSAGTVRRAESLGHGALAAELAGLLIDDLAVADVVLVEGDAWRWLAQQLGKPGLAHLDRQPAQVLAVEFEQVEGAEHGREARGPGTDQIEHREPAVVADDGSPSGRSAPAAPLRPQSAGETVW